MKSQLDIKMKKIYDIFIAGSGPSALALAENTSREGLSTMVASPTFGERWIPNYGAWYADIERLGLGLCVEESWISPLVHLGLEKTFDLSSRYAKFSTPQLQTLLEYRCNRIGVQFLCKKVVHVEHLKKQSLVVFSDGDKISCRVFVDATGFSSSFLARPSQATSTVGFQTAYGMLLEVHETNWERGEMCLMDYRFPKGLSSEQRDSWNQIPTFLYALPLGKNLVFLEETCLVSTNPISYNMLKERLHKRISAMNIKPKRVIDEEHCLIAMGGPQPLLQQRNLGFGAAAGMVHPATGYQLTRCLSTAPKVARALHLGLEHDDPFEAVCLAWKEIWSKDSSRCWDMYQFGMEVLCSLSLLETQEFFQAFFSIPKDLWSGFLSANASPFAVSKAMAHVFMQGSPAMRKKLTQKAMNPRGLHLFCSIAGFSY